MAFPVLPTIQRMLDVLLARVVGSAGLQGLNTASGDDTWKTVNAFTRRGRAILVDFVGFSVNMIPSTATGIWLRRWANTYLSTPFLAATKMAGTVTLHCESGYTPSAPLTGATLTAPDGTQYVTTADVHDYDWTSDQATVAVQAVETGTAANQAVGTSLTLDSPPAHVEATAELASVTTEARDDETDPQLQARIGVETKYKPGGGNEADYRAWAMEVDGVTDCAVYPRWDGDTTITLVPVGPPGDRAVSAAVRTAVGTYIAGKRPMNVTPTVEGLTTTAPSQIVTMTVVPKPGFEPDWTGAIGVASMSGDRKTVYLDADPTGTIEIGHRVVGYYGVAFHSQQRIVDAVYGLPTPAIHVTEPFTQDLDAATDIDPGGPLWQPVRDAVEAVFDRLGPSASGTAGKERHPPVESGELPPHLRLSDLYAAVEAVDGVESCLFTLPASDVSESRTAGQTLRILEMDPHVTIDWA